MVFNRLRRIFRGPEDQPPQPEASTIQEVIAKSPRVIGLSMVKNEQDIIEPFIRHNIRFLDALVIMDNASLDATRDIALACAREFGNIIIGDSDEFSYNQSERMTRLLQYCQSAFFADYILFLDADEFISARDRAELLRALKNIPEQGVGRIPWRTYVVMPGQEDSAGTNAPGSFTHRRTTERPQFYKAVLRLDGQYVPDLVVSQGNHDVFRRGELLSSVNFKDQALLHFPVRSAAQIAAKSVVGWTAYLARNPNARQSSEGFQWREAFDRLSARGIGALHEQLSLTSMGYAQERMPPDWSTDVVQEAAPSGYQRRYSSGAFMEPLALLARSWERSLLPSQAVVKLERPASGTNAAGVTDTSFDAAWHWDHLFFDIQPFRFIAEKHQPEQVLDIGCGIGQYLALFKALGAKEIFGIDGVPAEAMRGVLEPTEYAAKDLAQPINLGRQFDLVICVEVAEHLDARDGGTLLDTVARHAAKRIVFSAAEPGQPGNGHINCQPLAYWLEQWAERGWVPDLVDSLGIRALSTMSWFRRNLVVLQPGRREEGRDATAALIEIAAKSYAWYAQPPGIRTTAFAAPLFGPGEAYHPLTTAAE